MEILDFFRVNFESISNNTDYKIAEFSHNFYIGIDRDKNIVVVIKTNSRNDRPYNINTKSLSLECNVKVCFSNGTEESVHILKCLLHAKREKEIFLELVKLFITDDYSDKHIINTFNVLQSFFSNRNELSDKELIGFYAELYTIYKFHDVLCIEKYWQIKDRMKFDFSFTEKLKLEIKATTKENRIHHFKHEQLNSNYFEIFILSYLFRYDDLGFSLYDLVEKVKPILLNDAERYLRLLYIEKNTNVDRLKKLKFNQIFTDKQMHLYNANDIPKFSDLTPDGVYRVEYDCSLEKINTVDIDDFFEVVRQRLAEELQHN